MRRLAILAGSGAVSASLLSTSLFAIEPGSFSATATVLISIGIGISSLVSLVGFLLVRAPWGRWALVATTGTGMILVATTDTWVVWIAYLCGTASIVLLVGPWLHFWTRKLPSVDSPGPVPTLLMATAPVAPFVVGVGAFDTDGWQFWTAAAVAMIGAVLYAWSVPGALWILRIGVPVTWAAAAAAAPSPWLVAPVIGGLAVTVVSWLPQAREAVSTPSPVLPAPLSPSSGSSS